MGWPPDRENSQLSFGWERPTVYTLGSGGVSATAIGSLTSAIAASYYVGQVIRVLSGNQAGALYWVIDNGSYTFTVQGNHTPNESGNAIGSGDRIAVSTRGIIPASLTNYNRYLGIVNAWTPPHKEQEVKSHFSHGSGVTRQKSFVTMEKFDGGSLPIIFQGRPEILMSMGKITCTGTDKAGGGGSTLSSAVYAWDNQISVGSKANYTTNDYIQIDTGTNAEVRKISGSVGSTFTLDHPLDYSHASGATCNEVEAPWTVTVKPATTINRTFCVVEGLTDPEGDNNPIIRIWPGCHTNSTELSSEENTEFKGTIGFMAMNQSITDDGTYTLPTVTLTAAGATEDPYFHDNSAIQHNSVDLAIVRSISTSWSWNMEPVRCHGANNGKKPYMYVRKYPTFDGSGKYMVTNDYLISKVDSTERDGYVLLTRGTNDSIQINWEDTIIGDKWNPPDEGPYEGEFTLNPEYVYYTIIIDDTAPMY